MSTQTNNSSLPPIINLNPLEVQQLENVELKATLVKQQVMLLKVQIGKRVGVDPTQYTFDWQQGVMILNSAQNVEKVQHNIIPKSAGVPNVTDFSRPSQPTIPTQENTTTSTTADTTTTSAGNTNTTV